MELKHDWKILNSVLFPQERLTIGSTDDAAISPRLVLLEDQKRITGGIVSTGAYFSDVGLDHPQESKEKLDALAAKYNVDQTVILNTKQLDQYITDAAALGHNYYQQLESIRARVTKQSSGNKGSALLVSRRHFVLDLVSGFLHRLLPRQFNLLIYIDTSQGSAFSYQAMLMTFQNGQVDQFFEPDFSSLHEDRLQEWRTQTDIMGQYLESRYLLPCYGIFIKKAAWDQCLEAARQKKRPWRLFTKAHDESLAEIYPYSWLTKILLAGQQIMVYFGRV